MKDILWLFIVSIGVHIFQFGYNKLSANLKKDFNKKFLGFMEEMVKK